jgi:putative SOS response-associated peptidase YedK
VCGRFVSSSSPERIAAYFGAEVAVEPLGENSNVAPTNDIYGVVAVGDDRREVQAFHWGLIPAWAKERKIGQRMINARAETLSEKPAFKSDFKKHRCIIPMDGFYEWAAGTEGGPITKAGKLAKRPFFIHRVDHEPLAVAGLWSAWKDRSEGVEAGWLHSAAVVTTNANATIEPIHNRMPVVLPKAMWEIWLDPANQNVEMLQKLLVPAPESMLTMHEVDTLVNNVRNKSAELIVPRESPRPHDLLD